MAPDLPPEPTSRQRSSPRRRRPLSGRKLTLYAVAEQLRLARAPRLLPSTRYLPPVIELHRINTSRLLPARYSESVLTRIADSDADLPLLYALDNATNERLLTEANRRPTIGARELVHGNRYAHIINAAFAHPHPQGARFSTPNRGAWYAAFDLATAKAEVLFHRSVQLAEISWNCREDLDYDHYYADFTGPFHDLCHLALPAAESTAGARSAEEQDADRLRVQRDACLDPRSYIASQHLALELLELHSLGVVYPSVRRTEGVCLACFQPFAVKNVRKRELHRLTWYPDKAPTFLRMPRSRAGSVEAEPIALPPTSSL